MANSKDNGNTSTATTSPAKVVKVASYLPAPTKGIQAWNPETVIPATDLPRYYKSGPKSFIFNLANSPVLQDQGGHPADGWYGTHGSKAQLVKVAPDLQMVSDTISLGKVPATFPAKRGRDLPQGSAGTQRQEVGTLVGLYLAHKGHTDPAKVTEGKVRSALKAIFS